MKKQVKLAPEHKRRRNRVRRNNCLPLLKDFFRKLKEKSPFFKLSQFEDLWAMNRFLG